MGVKAQKAGQVPAAMDDAWMDLMLSPYDYGIDALYDKETRACMGKITFSHGGPQSEAAPKASSTHCKTGVPSASQSATALTISSTQCRQSSAWRSGFCLGAAKAKPTKSKITAAYFMVRNLFENSH